MAIVMAEAKARPGESFESLMRRFKRAVERSGILSELKEREYYEKPSDKRKRREAAAIKRELKRQEKTINYFNGNQNFKFNKDKTKKIPIQNRRPNNNNYNRNFQKRTPNKG